MVAEDGTAIRTPSDPGRANQVGYDLPGFALIRRLGEGAEGGVFEGRALASGETVVLKRVDPAQGAAARHAFGVLRRVASPHLPPPRALIEAEDGASWLATAWVEGQPLPVGPTPTANAVDTLRQIGHGLAALHEAGTHHGDLSPANVVVDGRGRAVIVDLGQLGRQGTGTPGFLAPETLGGGGGPAADVFAWGCLLCWHWRGATPWTRPEDLVAVRGPADVRAALDRICSTALSPQLAGLLVRVLHPDPRRRPSSMRDVVRWLGRREEHQGTRWWMPARLPYRGVDLQAAEQAVVAGRARMIAVAGPPGSGRTRVVEALVHRLQARVGPARLAEPQRLGAALGLAGASWLEAWMRAPDRMPAVGLLEVPPELGAHAQTSAEPSLARIRAAAELASTVCVVPVPSEVGRSLSGHERVMVLHVRPWTPAELTEVVLDVRDDDEVKAWVRVLAEATGGWPGAVVRALAACAQQGVSEPTAAAVEGALRGSDGDPLGLDEATAADVLALRWCPDATRAASLPLHLHDGRAPHPAVVVAAKRRLGSSVLALARRHGAQLEDRPLALAVDADDADWVLQALRRHRAPRPDHPAAQALLDWVAQRNDVPSQAAEAAASILLARGEAETALALAKRQDTDPACALQAARALQRLGRVDEALAQIDGKIDTGTELGRRAHGLRMRLWVDRGELQRAEQAALELVQGERGLGAATCWLWAGYAALVGGQAQEARRRLESAARALGDDATPEAAATRARVAQLVGNLLHDRGDLQGALEAFDRAAEQFERSGEPVGGLTVRGSVAALCVPTLDVQRGLELGRAVVRGFLAGGQLSALPEATLNLVQLLVRIGGLEEAQRLERTLTRLLEEVDERSALVHARLARVRADLETGALERERAHAVDGRAWTAAERSYAMAGRALHRAGARREAVDAWLRAAGLARAGRRWPAARAHLGRARVAAGSGDPDLSCALSIEGLRLAAASAETEDALQAAMHELSATTTFSTLVESGRLELAWAHDRALWAALGRIRAPEPAKRRMLARRLLQTLEAIMKKTPNLDRSAVRSSLTAEGGEPDVLAELIEEARPASSRPHAPASGRTERLLRMYRRFAREERLEPLLEQVVDAMMDLTDAERGAVVVRGEQSNAATGSSGALEVTRELAAGTEGFRFSRSVIDRVLQTGESVLSVDAASDERFDESRSISHLNLRSVLAVPLRFRGELLGAAYVDHRLRRGNFDEEDLAHMEAFAELAALAVAHAQALAEVRAQAQALQAQGRELQSLLEVREAEVVELREEVRQQVGEGGRQGYRGIVGSTPAMRRVFRLIDRLGDSDVPVVVHGESGTGKELVARAIHEAGARAAGPFVAENCGAIPETLLESVLFGHAKGAFTGAAKAKAGLFEAADGGTIFLDEVGEMSPAMQTKLLRVLQEGEVRRVGENVPRPVDVRVITASNRDLETLVAQRAFRQDLYYRINVVRIDLPALRERVEDIPALVEHFVRRHAGERSIEITAPAMRLLAGHGWPGNVRELENEVQRWIALSDGRVGVDDLSSAVLGRQDAPGLDPDDLQIRPRVERLERELIARALERTGGNQTKAAELLGLSRYGLQKKLRRLEEADQG